MSKFISTLMLSLMLFTTACMEVSYTPIEGDRVRGEIIRSGGGLNGDDITAGVLDFQNSRNEWKTRDFLYNSTPIGKILFPALIPGMAVATIQGLIAKYQVDNQCTTCGDITNILTASNSTNLTEVQVQAIAEILNGQTGWTD